MNAYKDWSSDSTFTNDGAEAILLLSDGNKLEFVAASDGKISYLAGEILAVHKILEAYLNLSFAEQLNGITIFSDSRSVFHAIY